MPQTKIYISGDDKYVMGMDKVAIRLNVSTKGKLGGFSPGFFVFFAQCLSSLN